MNEVTIQRRGTHGARATALAMRLRAGSLPESSGASLAWAVCLLPAARLRRLVLHLGMLTMAGVLRQSIDAQAVGRLREVLGQPLYEFGMVRAPLLAPMASPLAQQLPWTPEAWPQGLYEEGMRIVLRVFLTHAPDLMPLLGRFVPLPPVDGNATAQCVPDAAQATMVTSRVLREVEPGWYRSFELDTRTTP